MTGGHWSRGIRFTPEQARELLSKTGDKRGLYRGDAGKKKRDDGYDSQLEADYAEHLAALKLAGEIEDFAYQPFRMKIAGGAYYTPDFLIVKRSLTADAVALRISSRAGIFIELHEVKGFWRESAAVRVKVAADKFPWFRFRIVSRERETDPWSFEDVNQRAPASGA